jgi:hypothetical protein
MFLSIDFNQRELRTIANLSKDARLVQLLQGNVDVIEHVKKLLISSEHDCSRFASFTQRKTFSRDAIKTVILAILGQCGAQNAIILLIATRPSRVDSKGGNRGNSFVRYPSVDMDLHS